MLSSYINGFDYCHQFSSEGEKTPKWNPNPPRKLPWSSLNKPALAATPGEPCAAPSVLTLIQPEAGAIHETFLMLAALPACLRIWKNLRIPNSCIFNRNHSFGEISRKRNGHRYIKLNCYFGSHTILKTNLVSAMPKKPNHINNPCSYYISKTWELKSCLQADNKLIGNDKSKLTFNALLSHCQTSTTYWHEKSDL